METKASMVVMSHLSDAQDCGSNKILTLNKHINFAKFIILETNGDLNKLIDADLMWENFTNRYVKL